jgi:putative DNA methylase
MPLTSKWWLDKKKGKEAFVVPKVMEDSAAPSGRRVAFEIGRDPRLAPQADADGTVGRTGATCVACGTAVELAHIRSEGRAKRLGVLPRHLGRVGVTTRGDAVVDGEDLPAWSGAV